MSHKSRPRHEISDKCGWNYWVFLTNKYKMWIKMLCCGVCKTFKSVKKLAWLWVKRCQACCGLCHQTCRPGVILQVLCHHYPRRDQAIRISWPGLETGEEEGGRMRWLGQEEAWCLGPVWAVGSLALRPGLNISRSGTLDLCQQAEETIYSRVQSRVSRPQTNCSLFWRWDIYCDNYYSCCIEVWIFMILRRRQI